MTTTDELAGGLVLWLKRRENAQAKALRLLVKDDGASVMLPRSYLEAGNLTHAYAVTGHKAQGMTTDKAFVQGDETLYREWAYVAMSRGRKENHLYVVSGLDPGREDVGGQVAPVSDPMKELVRALGRSRGKELALDAYERQAITGLTTKELRHELERAEGVLAGAPPDCSAELRAAEERARLDALLKRHQESAMVVTTASSDRSSSRQSRTL